MDNNTAFMQARTASNGITIVSKKGTSPDVIKLTANFSKKVSLGFGEIKNLELTPKFSKVTEHGFNTVREAFLGKVRSFLPDVESEMATILKTYSNAGLIKNDSTIPSGWFKLDALGNKNDEYPSYIGLALSQPLVFDTKTILQIGGFTEDELKTHLEDVKAYWSIVNSANSSVILDLVKKINNDEESFYNKAWDFVTYAANKTLSKPWGVTSLLCIGKNSDFMKYCQDPWGTFAIDFSTIAAPNGQPNYAVYAYLASFENKEFANYDPAKYTVWPTLYYKVEKGLFNSFKFTRNGQSY